jgi:ATP-dependent DNA helicase RecG
MSGGMNIQLNEIPVHKVRGISPAKAKELEAFGIATVLDLLEYYPFRYEDYRLRRLDEVRDGDKVTVQGTIYSEPVHQVYGYRKSRLSCKVKVDQLLITAVWFNRPFLKDKLRTGQEIVLTGKWEQRRLQITVAESEFPGGSGSQTGTLQPVYSVGGAITQKWLRKQIKQALEQFSSFIPEIIPQRLIDRHSFPSRKQAIYYIHHPEELENGQNARARMVYEELFLFQMKLQAFRYLTKSKQDGHEIPVDHEAVRAFVRGLPFRLTESQKKVIAEILEDMKKPSSMNRLLQGDVGSGKTVVAAVGLFAAVKAGYQGALMVPTEILAEQHKASLGRLFEAYGITVELLTGSMTERQRRDVLAGLQSGLTDIVVGTHAIIQDHVVFHRLGLVVTDEQHRFGVNQRSILRRKGMNPDVLTMTATPIPRTLAITVFGDMDVSTLRELPKGRKPIKTYWVRHDMLERVYGFFEKEASNGRQSYVICPLIEESEKLDVQNAIDVYNGLRQQLPRLGIGLLHGRMSASDKEQVMLDFKERRLDVLVSTTVIEVGVDVPNATVMAIYDADRFGLSQLHQLRGRVGRGEQQSYCILIANPKNEIARERMSIMTETNDGFEIARRDLELRGPGDFFGTKQSGLPEFRIADMSSDFAVLEEARDDAAELVSSTDFWTSLEYAPLRDYLQRQLKWQGESWD